MFGQKRLNPRIVGSMLGQHSPRLTPGAAAERQEVKICTTSSILKNCSYHEERKAGGNRVEPSGQRFWAEGSDKGVSSLYLRPNLQPIYQKPFLSHEYTILYTPYGRNTIKTER